MKDRITVEEGPTSRQVFNEVYFDIVEEYHDKKYDGTGESMVEDEYQEKQKYMRRVVKRLQETDDEFRWLSLVPCRDERGKIKENRYVNIKARNPDGSDSELLAEVTHSG